MNRHLSARLARMVWTALLLVPVLAQAQSPSENSYIGTYQGTAPGNSFVTTTPLAGKHGKSTPDSPIDLYVGPQLALVRYSNVDMWAGFGAAGASVSVEDDVSWGAILGLDVPLGTRGWMVHANVRYLDTDMKDSGGVSSFNGKFDPVIFSVGVGYRF